MRPSRLALVFLAALAGAPAASVPAGHPRVYVTSRDLPALREKLTLPEFRADWEEIKAAQGDARHGYFFSAFVYLATGDKAAGRRAVEGGLSAISASTDARTYGMPFHLTGIVYDWCYDLLTAEEKQRFIAEFERIAKSHPPGVPASLKQQRRYGARHGILGAHRATARRRGHLRREQNHVRRRARAVPENLCAGAQLPLPRPRAPPGRFVLLALHVRPVGKLALPPHGRGRRAQPRAAVRAVPDPL